MDVEQLKKNLSSDLYDQIKIIDGSVNDEQARHNYLEKIAKLLFKDSFNLEYNRVFFCISENAEPDAAFVFSASQEKNAEVKSTPVFYITTGLLNVVQNEDQLAFVLNTELKHIPPYFSNSVINAGIEALDSDVAGMERMINAGYNIFEARKLISHVLINTDKYPILAQKIADELGEYANNESRLNALDLKIKTLEEKYQKQNIDINTFVPTGIPAKIKTTAGNGVYKSGLRKILTDKGYEQAGLLQKQNILIDVLQNFIDTDKPLSHIKQCQIEDAVLCYIADLRRNMPRRIISQTDYEFLCSYNPEDEEKRQAHWQKLFNFAMPINIEIRKSILGSFPQKIVDNQDFAEQNRLNELVAIRQKRELNDGMCLNVLFWDKLLKLETNLPDGNVLSIYNGCVLNGIDNININMLSTGKQILEDIEKIFRNEPYLSYPRRVWHKFSNIDDNFTADKPSAFLPAELQASPHQHNMLFQKFNLAVFPQIKLEASEADINKQIPIIVLRSHTYENITGLSAKEIYSDRYLVKYQTDFREAPLSNLVNNKTWFYIASADGKISDSFEHTKVAEKIKNLTDSQEQIIYEQLAKEIQEYYNIIHSAAEDASKLANLKTAELMYVKGLTAPYKYVTKQTGVSLLDYCLEMQNPHSTKVAPQKQPIENFLTESFKLLKTSSEIGEAYSEFNGEKLKKMLSSEVMAFINSKYNQAEDNAVFNAYLQHIVKDVNAAEHGWKLDVIHPADSDIIVNAEDVLKSPRNHRLFTEEQFKTYYNALFKEVDVKKLLDLGLLSKNNTVIPEIKHLALFTISELNKSADKNPANINFKQYQPLFYDQLAKLLNLPADFAQFNDEDLLNRQKDIAANLQIGILLYILTDESHKFPLDILAKHPIYELKDLQRAKLAPYLLKRENYPQETIAMALTYRKLYLQNLINDTAGIEFVINQIKNETDAQKALNASLEIADIVNRLGDNRLKNLLVEDNPAFNTKLFNKIEAYQKLSAAGAFADDYVFQNKFLESFIPEIENIRDANLKNSYYDIFISKQHRIANPDIRRRYHQLWVQSVFAACGSQIDDKSTVLYNKVKPYAEKLHGHYVIRDMAGSRLEENLNPADRIEISSLLADRFIAQKELSALLKPQPADFNEMNEEYADNNHFQIAGFDFIKALLRIIPSETDSIIGFLISSGSMEKCKDYCEYLNAVKQTNMPAAKLQISPQTLQIMYHEYWGYPAEARAVILNELLQAASIGTADDSWERVFRKIAVYVFPNADDKLAQLGYSFLHSYIQAHQNQDRALYLVAMITAANLNAAATESHKSIAAGLRLFLENSGPEAVKVSQALVACTTIPWFIREEIKNARSIGRTPARWELFEWLDFYNKQENSTKFDYKSDIWLGRIIKSSACFVTLEKGVYEQNKAPFESDRIIKILRAGIRLAVTRELSAFETMLYDLSHQGYFRNGIDDVLNLIRQSVQNLMTETDLQLGYNQQIAAQKIYNNREIENDGYKFKFHIADWIAYGNTWAEIERATGSELDSIKNLRYRQAAAKTYFTFEISNLLSGRQFDHNQIGHLVRINPEQNIISIFDLGASALVPPSEKDKELLGKIIYRTLEKFINDAYEGNAFRRAGFILSSEIDTAYRKKLTLSSYLAEAQSGLNSLVDFYKDFSETDFLNCITGAIDNENMPIDTALMKGFIGEGLKDIGLFESEQPVLSSQDKELLGALLFNMYADSFKYLPTKIGSVIKKEIIKTQQLSEENLSLLKIIADKIKELDKSSLSTDLPKEFIPSIGEMVNRQNVDSSILKGFLKEVIATVNQQENGTPFSPEDRYEFGRLLYDTFNFTVADNSSGQDPDMMTTYQMLYKSGNYKSQYAAKIAAIVNLVKTVKMTKEEHGISSADMVKAILLTGKGDPDIIDGMNDTFKNRTPNSLSRTVVGKGLELFLAQEQTEPSVLKRALIKIFIRKKNAVSSNTDLNETIGNPANRKYLITMIQNYIAKLSRLHKQYQSNIDN